MHRLSLFAFAFCAVALLAIAPKHLTAVPAGTVVTFHLNDPLSSNHAQANQTFTFTVANDVVVNGMIVVEKGAQGQGHVVEASGAHMFGRGGTLTVTYDWVTSADGKRLRIQNVTSTIGDNNVQTATNIAVTESATVDVAGNALGGAVPFVGAAVSALGMAKGKNISVGTDVLLQAYVAETVHVATTQKATLDSAYDH